MDEALSLFSLTGKVALVTGSTMGIGYGIARGLASAGACVVLNGRRREALGKATEQLQNQGFNVRQAAFDVTDRAAVVAAVDGIEAEVGPIEILINNAGIQRRAPFDEFPEATWHEIMAANLDSVFFMAQAVGRRMIARRHGKIINICSVASELGRPTIIPYAATKGAVKMLTKGLCAEWAKHNIQVNGIGPGYIKTDLNNALMADENFSRWVCSRTPAGRWAEIDEVAGAAIFLSSDAANYVNGHILYVDGGLTAVV
jgi:gluconate 5-dehydrogenase